MLIWNSETTQKPKHLSSPNRSSYFLATKHEKTIMACSYLNFSSHTENTSKQQKMVAFVKNCLVKMTLRLLQSIFVVMNVVPMLLRQFRRLAHGHCSGFSIVGGPPSYQNRFFLNPPSHQNRCLHVAPPHLKMNPLSEKHPSPLLKCETPFHGMIASKSTINNHSKCS